MYCTDMSRDTASRIFAFRTVLISFVWIVGLLFGCHLGLQLTDSGILLMYNAIRFPFSFASLYFILFLPFILSALFVRLSAPLLSLIVVFIKALSIGCCTCGIMLAYSSAGWLIRFLLLFSDTLIIILLIWFWIRNIAGDGKKLNADVFLSAVFLFIISCVDYFVVSVFLSELLNI